MEKTRISLETHKSGRFIVSINGELVSTIGEIVIQGKGDVVGNEEIEIPNSPTVTLTLTDVEIDISEVTAGTLEKQNKKEQDKLNLIY